MSLLLAGCASPPSGGSSATNSLRPGIGKYRVGPPYEINGVWYYPAVNYNYDRTGVASWYGEEFEGRLTANGEIFDLNGLTAAHTTLPMPSIVRVTNLENGRSIQLRVNDRGPFVDGRLIDVSRRAAQLLGFETQGTAPVRVTILRDESITVAEEAMRNSPQVVVAEASRMTLAPALGSAAAAYSSASTAPHLAPITTSAQIAELSARPAQIAAVPREPAVGQRQASRRLAMVSTEPSPPSPASSQPQIPMAPSAPPQSLQSLAPPRPPSRYRFALISPAEASELPPASAAARRPEIGARSSQVLSMPPSLAKVSAVEREPAGRIFVQAGAFARRDNAERVEARIARLGNVRITSVSSNGVAMYRVRLGPFANTEQASRLLGRVVDSGYPQARIVGD